MEQSTPPFKATYNDLKQSTLGLVLYRDNTLIKIDTEYLNPLRCEGYASVFLQVDEQHYKRCFESTVADKYLINFINKFVNDEEYRQDFSVD